METIKRIYQNGNLIKEIKTQIEKVGETKRKIGEILLSPKFEDLIYSDRQKEFMQLVLKRLKMGIPLHLLFNGYAGTGKTYSAKMIACELEKPFVYLNGQMNQKKIRDIMLNLKDNAVVCIDEIHNLSEKVSEVIYPAIEYNELSLDGKTIKLNDPTFIGTTTEPEGLPKPLLDRLFRVEFEEPSDDLIKKILLKRGLEEDLINKMIKFSTNIRVLNKMIKLLDLYGSRTKENLFNVFKNMRINPNTYLTEEQEKYLNYLKNNGKSSLRTIALVLRVSEERLKYDTEPELIKKGLIKVTSRGRELA